MGMKQNRANAVTTSILHEDKNIQPNQWQIPMTCLQRDKVNSKMNQRN